MMLVVQAVNHCRGIVLPGVLRYVLLIWTQMPFMHVRSVNMAVEDLPDGCGALPCPATGRGGRVPC